MKRFAPSTVHASEMASLAERMVYLQIVRAGFAALVLTAAAVAPDLLGVSFAQIALVTAAYIASAVVGEGLRRLVGWRGLMLVAIGLMIDGLYLAWLAYVTGGVHSPLRFLVYVHLIAVTILASYRSGLKIALWHSLLIFGVVYLQNAGILHVVSTPLLPATDTPEALQRLSVLNVTAFWVVALGAAAVSSINERELRRRKLDFEGLATMASDLENTPDPHAIARMTLDRVGPHFGFGRAAFVAFVDEGATVLATRDCASEGGDIHLDAVLDRARRDRDAVLVKALDEASNPGLTELMPDARNVMVMPLIAEGAPVGTLVLEKATGGPRVPRQVVAMVGQFASHAALALRNAWLMETVQRMAETDPLTGVANRRVFENTLERELSRATRSGEQVTLVMIDVDHFKSFNDTFGHQAGDDVLRGVAAAVQTELRHFDTIARYGGEEFAVVLPECSSEEAGLVGERLRVAVSRVEAPRPVTASAGVATFPADATAPEALIRAADDALYASKEAGRDRVTLYRRLADAQTAAKEQEALELEAAAGRWPDSKRGILEGDRSTDVRALTLARAGASLAAATSQSHIFDAVMEAASALMGQVADAQVLLVSGTQIECTVVAASGTPLSPGHVVSLHGQPDPVAAALVEHRSVEGALGDERASAWGFQPKPEHVFAIPVVVGGQLTGAIVTGTASPLTEEGKYALEVLGAKATVALERLAVRNDLATIEKKFTSLIHSSSDGISIVDVEGTFRYQTPALERLLGFRGDELVGMELTDLVHPDDTAAALRFIARLLNATDDEVQGEWRMRRYDSSYVYVKVRGRNLLDDPGLNGLVLTLQDVTERRALEHEVNVLASRDLLTNLGNRPFFLDHLQRTLNESDESAGSLAVLLLNLDDFKTVNDSLGPEAGDELIVEAAERLRSCLRGQDSLARLGGDEFAILLRDTSGLPGIKMVAQRLRDSLRAPFGIRGNDVFVSASIGIAPFEPGQGPAELLRNADVAMHMAKQSDKGNFKVFEPRMHDAVVHRMQITNDLQRAIEQGELRLVYQPIVDMTTQEVVAAEALVRWQHPTRGLIAPADFIPLAETSGLILPLGSWVLDQVGRRMGEWKTRFAGRREVSVSVNLSALQLQQPDFVGEVAAVLRTHELTPQSLILEITESVLLDEADALGRLEELRDLGVRLALDDFGTGYSSLGYLRSLDVDILKIDRAFVENVDSESAQAELLDAIVRIGRSLNMATLAEGVEDPEQVKMLRRIGCDLGQGFFFHRPMSAEALEELLEESPSIV